MVGVFSVVEGEGEREEGHSIRVVLGWGGACCSVLCVCCVRGHATAIWLTLYHVENGTQCDVVDESAIEPERSCQGLGKLAAREEGDRWDRAELVASAQRTVRPRSIRIKSSWWERMADGHERTGYY